MLCFYRDRLQTVENIDCLTNKSWSDCCRPLIYYSAMNNFAAAFYIENGYYF